MLQQLSHYVILVILFLFSQKIYHDITCLLRIVVFCWEIPIPAVYYVVFCPLGCVIVLNKLGFSFYVFLDACVSRRQVT